MLSCDRLPANLLLSPAGIRTRDLGKRLLNLSPITYAWILVGDSERFSGIASSQQWYYLVLLRGDTSIVGNIAGATLK